MAWESGISFRRAFRRFLDPPRGPRVSHRWGPPRGEFRPLGSPVGALWPGSNRSIQLPRFRFPPGPSLPAGRGGPGGRAPLRQNAFDRLSGPKAQGKAAIEAKPRKPSTTRVSARAGGQDRLPWFPPLSGGREKTFSFPRTVAPRTFLSTSGGCPSLLPPSAPPIFREKPGPGPFPSAPDHPLGPPQGPSGASGGTKRAKTCSGRRRLPSAGGFFPGGFRRRAFFPSVGRPSANGSLGVLFRPGNKRDSWV